MQSPTASAQFPTPAPTRDVVVRVADFLIEAGLTRRATALWIEPTDRSGRHRVTIERDTRRLTGAELPPGLGEAVIVRLALLCELAPDPLRVRTGRTQVRCGPRAADLVVTARPSPAGLRAEVLFRGPAPTPAEVLPDRLTPGLSIGSYRVIDTIGAGGMAAVYRVEHTALGRTFALKVLHRAVIASATCSVDRFLAEARAAARIRHPGIVTVTDFGRLADGRPFLVMELVEGRALGARLRAGALEPAAAVAIAGGVADALHAAHQAGVVHGDLTPANVMVVPGETPAITLLDFGSAHVRGITTGSGDIVLGTPCYISPEQIVGEPPDERSDIYSLGVMLYEMLAGAPPFESDNLQQILHQHLRTQPSLPASPYGAMPAGLVRVVLRCLRKTRETRFQSAAELADELSVIDCSLQRRGWRRWVGR